MNIINLDEINIFQVREEKERKNEINSTYFTHNN